MVLFAKSLYHQSIIVMYDSREAYHEERRAGKTCEG
jgi:hypothetical protein